MEMNDEFEQVMDSIGQDTKCLVDEMDKIVKKYWDGNQDFFYRPHAVTCSLCTMIFRTMVASGFKVDTSFKICNEFVRIIVKLIETGNLDD